MKPYRSLLFVPGHKPDWVDKAIACGSDALVLDLEDSVPDDSRAETRHVVAESIDRIRAENDRIGIYVRPTPLTSGSTGDDLATVVRPGLTGLLVPKVRDRDDIIRYDALLSHFEHASGTPAGSVGLLVSLETSSALASCEEIAKCPRIHSMFGGGARGADQARAVGYQWTGTGLETLHLRSRVVLACRAAGVNHPLCSIWQDIADIDGLVSWAEMNRSIGCRGQVVIHPSHVEHVNRVFTLSAEELDYYRCMIAEFEAAVANNHGAIKFRGAHVDYAHITTAREWLELAEQMNG